MTTPALNSPAVSPYGQGVPVTVGKNGGQGTGLLATGIGLIIGFNIVNQAATAVFTAYLFDGDPNTGQYLMGLQCAAGAAISRDIGLPGCLFRRGIYFSDYAGHGAIAVTYVPLLTQP